MIIIIKIRRPKGEALENFPPAEGRPVGGGAGGREPPRYRHPLLQPKGRSAREFPAGRRPASRGGAGGQRPPAQHYSIIILIIINNHYYIGKGGVGTRRGGAGAPLTPPRPMMNRGRTTLLSNQIRCWEGGMGGGYPLPNHLIWLDNKLINIHSLISTH